MIELTVLAALVVGLVQVVKKTNIISDQYMPVVAIIIGLAMSLLLEGTMQEMVVNGLTIGLMSVGMFSGVRSVLK